MILGPSGERHGGREIKRRFHAWDGFKLSTQLLEGGEQIHRTIADMAASIDYSWVALLPHHHWGSAGFRDIRGVIKLVR